MPVTATHPIRILDQDRFGKIAYEVVEQSYYAHDQLGRFFNEDVYQSQLQRVFGQRATSEVWIDVTCRDFLKRYRLDLLVDDGALFELKAVDRLHDQHRSQLLNYLMLTGLHHGKLINFRPAKLEHEFVNCHVSLETRRAFQVRTEHWDSRRDDCQQFQQILLELLADWGTGLDLALYEEAVTHFFGASESVERKVAVMADDCVLGHQIVRLISPDTSFKLTALSAHLDEFVSHARRFLRHTGLRQIAWANITLNEVVFRMLDET
jgi:GxxExxY protein